MAACQINRGSNNKGVAVTLQRLCRVRGWNNAAALFFLAAFALAAAAGHALVEQAGDGGTQQRGYDKEPQLAAGTPGGTVAENSLADGAGGVDARVGQRDAHQVDERQREADGETGGLGVATLVGGAQDNHQEHECQHGLGGEGTPHGDVQVAALHTAAGGLEVGPVAVGGEDARGAHAGRLVDAEQHGTGDDGADNLAHPVEQHLFETHASVDPHAETHGGVEVGAAHMADAVGHGDDGETEGDSHAEEAHMAEQCGSAAAQHQDERAEAFGKHFVGNLHSSLAFIG